MVDSVVLAAGPSRRMGFPKALLRWEGTPWVRRVCEVDGEGGCTRVIVVSRPQEYTQVLEALEGLEGEALVVPHKEWSRGRTGTLQEGLRLCREGPVLVHPVDHPLVLSTTVRALLEESRGENWEVLVPTYQGRGGHPIVLGPKAQERVRLLGPDEPLRTIVHHSLRRDVPVKDPGILLNLDNPSDLERIG